MRHYSPVKKVSVFTGYLALLGCLITVLQTIMILYKGDPFCVNQGCEIVESLTTVPQLYFNGAGFVYFLLVFFCARAAGRGGQLSRRLLINLLTAGICAEAVLINFQYYVAETFCWYCLIIFALILLLNLSLGIKQIVRAAFLFGVMSLAFASLDFKARSSVLTDSYQSGVFAIRPGSGETDIKVHLFFSSTCVHCEQVIEIVKETDQLTIAFNPIDEVDALKIKNIEYMQQYSSERNRGMLSALQINEIPVLLIQDHSTIEIIRGEKAISSKIIALEQTLEGDAFENGSSQSTTDVSSQMTSSDDGCTVETECEEGELIPQSGSPADSF